MTSGEYWEKRAIERALRLERGTLPYIRKLASLYVRAYRSLREDLDRLFERYVETGDFSPEEAAAYLREPVTPKERKILEDALKGITDEDERRKAVARINSASYRARMDRLHAMQERIRIECAKTAPDVIDTIRQAMERSGREAYYRTIFDNSKAAGVQLPFTDLSLERLEGVINQKIEGKSFSSRVWGNTNAVAQLLTDTLKENVATGRSWRRSVSDMRELLGVDYPGGATYAATRILRTETARVNNELSAEANVENGFDRYRYIAMLDSKTSEACRDHDGGIDPDTKKPYTYKNKKLGVNFPPLHPNCRSTTCAWVSEELLAKITRSAKDENGNVYQIPGNMTYREWEKERQIKSLRQSSRAPAISIPEEEDKDLFGYLPELSLPEDRIQALKRLYDISRKTGFEYATVYSDGRIIDEAFTSGDPSRVEVDLSKYPGDKLEIYHSHTNVTTFSNEDLRYLCDPRVVKIGVVSGNGDVYNMDASYGFRPSVNEYQDLSRDLTRECDEVFFKGEAYAHLSSGEKAYLAIKEQAFRTANRFEWQYEEGTFDE